MREFRLPIWSGGASSSCRRGREFVGLCPFHKEKTPSFSVVEDKGFYHCFGCGAHGDVISFVMQTEGLGFLEAVEDLARRAGLEVPKPTREEHDRAVRTMGLQGAVRGGLRSSSRRRCMRRKAAQARHYLEGRGLDEATIRRFRLGFAPDRRDALKRALGAACSPSAAGRGRAAAPARGQRRQL